MEGDSEPLTVASWAVKSLVGSMRPSAFHQELFCICKYTFLTCVWFCKNFVMFRTWEKLRVVTNHALPELRVTLCGHAYVYTLLFPFVKIYYFYTNGKWLNLMCGNTVKYDLVVSAELNYFCTFIPVLGIARRTIVTATIQYLITGHYYRLPASERCDTVRYGKSSPLKLKNRC